MRWLIFLVVTAAIAALPSHAAEKATVEQLEQILASHAAESSPAKHNSSAPEAEENQLLDQLGGDDELVPIVEGLELSERLSATTMYRMVWKYHLGPHMQQALEELSDQTALLELPAREMPLLDPPDSVKQQAMFEAARVYVVQELSHLPNFIATETTTRFNNAPPPLKYWQSSVDSAGFRRLGITQRQITFQDGKEVALETPNSAQTRTQVNALESRGEFGTEAAVVLMDLRQGNVTFSHWEQTLAGLAAVYRYSVPRASSHYQVNDECDKHRSFHDIPGYHGTLALDPKTGAIFRMTLQAELNSDDPVSHVASVVEYGPVVLGHHRSICPLRSLTFMVEETNGCSQGSRKLQKPLSMINQTVFSNYHRFGSSSTIILNEASEGQPGPGLSSERQDDGPVNKAGTKPDANGQSKHP